MLVYVFSCVLLVSPLLQAVFDLPLQLAFQQALLLAFLAWVFVELRGADLRALFHKKFLLLWCAAGLSLVSLLLSPFKGHIFNEWGNYAAGLLIFVYSSFLDKESRRKTDTAVLAGGSEEHVAGFMLVVGSKSDMNLKELPSRIIHSRVIVTRKDVIGRTLEEVKLESQYNVVATRVSRADVEFIVSDKYVLQFADNLVIVGEESSVTNAAAMLGNSPKDLNHPQLVPAFIGIALGVILGSIPIKAGTSCG